MDKIHTTIKCLFQRVNSVVMAKVEKGNLKAMMETI